MTLGGPRSIAPYSAQRALRYAFSFIPKLPFYPVPHFTLFLILSCSSFCPVPHFILLLILPCSCSSFYPVPHFTLFPISSCSSFYPVPHFTLFLILPWPTCKEVKRRSMRLEPPYVRLGYGLGKPSAPGGQAQESPPLPPLPGSTSQRG